MKDRLLQQIDEGMASMVQLRAEIANLPSLELIDHTQASTPGSVILSMPYNIDALKANQQRMEAAGWTPMKDYPMVNPSTGTLVVKYEKDGLEICILAYPGYAGATCTRRQIGTETQPIYEITCGKE